MTIHTDVSSVESAPVRARREAGKRAYFAGRSAEHAVAASYDRLGYDLVHIRWRGRGGEIDLIFRSHDAYVFVEVKQARSHEQAVLRLRRTQMQRIHAAASEFLAHTPDGQLSNVRFDLATVDGTGDVQVIENAFGHF